MATASSVENAHVKRALWFVVSGVAVVLMAFLVLVAAIFGRSPDLGRIDLGSQSPMPPDSLRFIFEAPAKRAVTLVQLDIQRDVSATHAGVTETIEKPFRVLQPGQTHEIQVRSRGTGFFRVRATVAVEGGSGLLDRIEWSLRTRSLVPLGAPKFGFSSDVVGPLVSSHHLDQVSSRVCLQTPNLSQSMTAER